MTAPVVLQPTKPGMSNLANPPSGEVWWKAFDKNGVPLGEVFAHTWADARDMALTLQSARGLTREDIVIPERTGEEK